MSSKKRESQLATLVYVRTDLHTLMILRNKKPDDVHEGKWNGLGGKFEPGESPEQCAIREVKEESGLSIRNPVMKGVLTFPEFAQGRDWYMFVFVAKDFSGELRPCSEGELSWVPNKQMLSRRLWEGDHFFLPLLDRPGVFSGRFVYQEGKFESYELKSY